MVWQEPLLVTLVKLVDTLPIETVKIQGDPLQLEYIGMFIACISPASPFTVRVVLATGPLQWVDKDCPSRGSRSSKSGLNRIFNISF